MGESLNRVIVLSNSTEWCYYSWKGVLSDKNICFFRDGIPLKSEGLLKKIWIKHFFTLKKDSTCKYPLRSIWYQRMCNDMGLNESGNFTIITYDWNRLAIDQFFYLYIRRNYPNVKLVYLFSNIVKITGANTYGYLNDLKSYFDVIFAFDKCDAEKYGFRYSPLVYVGNGELPKTETDVDLFYIGHAKDDNRLNLLLDIYEKAEREGLRCDFHIVGVESAKQKFSDKIKYNKRMGYFEALQRINKARCLVDVIQEDSTGLTIKTCESVLYNKKLITTNSAVTSESFYSKDRILLYDKSRPEGLRAFIESNFNPYTKEDQQIFSPYVLFKEIETV